MGFSFNRVRADHWVPFCVVTNLPSIQASLSLAQYLAQNRMLQPKFRGPAALVHKTWSIPKSITDLSGRLAAALEQSEYKNDQVKLLWERDDYRPENVLFPEWVVHDKLQLKRGRFPIVEGFDLKTLKDEDGPEQVEEVKRRDIYRGWKPMVFPKWDQVVEDAAK